MFFLLGFKIVRPQLLISLILTYLTTVMIYLHFMRDSSVIATAIPKMLHQTWNSQASIPEASVIRRLTLSEIEADATILEKAPKRLEFRVLD